MVIYLLHEEPYAHTSSPLLYALNKQNLNQNNFELLVNPLIENYLTQGNMDKLIEVVLTLLSSPDKQKALSPSYLTHLIENVLKLNNATVQLLLEKIINNDSYFNLFMNEDFFFKNFIHALNLANPETLETALLKFLEFKEPKKIKVFFKLFPALPRQNHPRLLAMLKEDEQLLSKIQGTEDFSVTSHGKLSVKTKGNLTLSRMSRSIFFKDVTITSGGELSETREWDNNFEENIMHDFGFSQFDTSIKSFKHLATLKTFTITNEEDLLHEANAHFYGLAYGLYSIPKVVGTPPEDEKFILFRYLGPIDYDISQDINLQYKISFNNPPDFVQVIAVGQGIDNLTCLSKWDSEKTTENIIPILASSSYPAHAFGKGHDIQMPSEPIQDYIKKNDAPLLHNILDSENSSLIHNKSILSGFKKKYLNIDISLKHHPSQDDTEWYIHQGIVGIFVKPFFLDQYIASPGQINNFLTFIDKIENSDAAQEIIESFGFLLNILKQKLLPAELSFALREIKLLPTELSFVLREILMSRLKSTSDLALKEIFAQLMRLLNRFQMEYIIPNIHTELKKLGNNIGQTDAQLTKLLELEELIAQGNLSGKTEVLKQLKSTAKEVIETESLDLEKIAQVKDALSCFLDNSENVCKDQMTTAIAELKTLFPQDSEIGTLLNEINQDVLTLQPEALYTLLSKIVKTLGDIQAESASQLEKMKSLCQEIEDFPIKNISWKEINDKINQIKISSQKTSVGLIEQKRDLKIKLDLIQTDSVIFETEEPWEQLN